MNNKKVYALHLQPLEKASDVERSNTAPTVTRALGSARLMAAACLFMKRNILNIGISASDQPMPLPAKMDVLKQGLLSLSVLIDPSGSLMISQDPKAWRSFKAVTIGWKIENENMSSWPKVTTHDQGIVDVALELGIIPHQVDILLVSNHCSVP